MKVSQRLRNAIPRLTALAVAAGLLQLVPPRLIAQTGPGDLLRAYLTDLRTEKVYVIHDKPFYAAGETVWCKVLLVDGRTHRPYAGTPLVYADWIAPDGTVSRTYTLQVRGGAARLDIATAAGAATGDYTLRVYSRYQRNFDPAFRFQKRIRVQGLGESPAPDPSVPANYTLRFFPEGGHLVNSLRSAVAFQARNDRGEPVTVGGVLRDAAGQSLGDLITLSDGMGVFRFTPTAGSTYHVEVTDGNYQKTFVLPPALPSGHTLAVTTRTAAAIRVTLAASPGRQLAGCVLIGQTRGTVFLDEQLSEGRAAARALAKRRLPSGVLHFTLLDPAGRPVAERLVVNRNPEEAVEVSVATDRPVYAPRAAVTVRLGTRLAGQPVPAALAVSVFRDEDSSEDGSMLDIKNYLWLQSELRGRVCNIGRYFGADDARTSTLLDLLLMTHGWRKFRWQDVLAARAPALAYAAEEHLTVAGRITRSGRPRPVVAEVQLNVLSEDNFALLSTTTGEDGRFAFPGLDFTDTTNLILRATRNGNRYVDVALLRPDTLPFVDSLSLPATTYRPASLRAYAYDVLRRRAAGWSIDLATVTVRSGRSRAQLREERIERRYREKDIFYFSNSQKFEADDPQFDGFRTDNIFQLIGLIVPRATYVQTGGRRRVVYGGLSGGVEPTLVLDGVVVSPAVLNRTDPADIAVIDVLEGDFARMYDNASLAISLVTKTPGERVRPEPGVLTLRHPGYYAARVFYGPDYAEPVAAERPADYRTTLYWNPDVSTRAADTHLRFHAGDLPGNYRIRVEGITADGLPCTGEGQITVRGEGEHRR